MRVWRYTLTQDRNSPRGPKTDPSDPGPHVGHTPTFGARRIKMKSGNNLTSLEQHPADLPLPPPWMNTPQNHRSTGTTSPLLPGFAQQAPTSRTLRTQSDPLGPATYILIGIWNFPSGDNLVTPATRTIGGSPHTVGPRTRTLSHNDNFVGKAGRSGDVIQLEDHPFPK